MVVACGPSLVRGGLHCGLLFITPGPTLEKVRLAPPDGGESITVFIPTEYQDLPEPQWFAGVTLATEETT